MDTIESLARDERSARVVLATGSEPGDAITGRLLASLGAVATVRLATSASVPSGIDRVEADLWRRRVVPRLSVESARGALGDTDRLGLRVLVPGDELWPGGLADLREHAPVALWVKGEEVLLSAPIRDRVAVVGARAATGYGEHLAVDLADDLVRAGRQVFSGGAYGIDGAAHRAVLASGGATVAVLAGGLDRLYPAGHRELLERIGEKGALVSELPPGATPTRWRFLQRNRLLAALSGAVVVVEAGYRSGALSTASHAVALGRPVGAVPGPVTSAASAGCHRLLREGVASIVTDAQDIDTLLAYATGSTNPESGRVARSSSEPPFTHPVSPPPAPASGPTL